MLFVILHLFIAIYLEIIDSDDAPSESMFAAIVFYVAAIFTAIIDGFLVYHICKKRFEMEERYEPEIADQPSEHGGEPRNVDI